MITVLFTTEQLYNTSIAIINSVSMANKNKAQTQELKFDLEPKQGSVSLQNIKPTTL